MNQNNHHYKQMNDVDRAIIERIRELYGYLMEKFLRSYRRKRNEY